MTLGGVKDSTSGIVSDTSAKEKERLGFKYSKGNFTRFWTNTVFHHREFHRRFIDLLNGKRMHAASVASFVTTVQYCYRCHQQATFQVSFYSYPVDAVYKAPGVL